MSSGEATRPDWPGFARRVIELAVRSSDTRRAVAPDAPPKTHGGVFVTLRKLRQLRGCIGTLDPDLPLAEAVRDAAVGAALNDPRFPAVTADELGEVSIEVSILSPPWPMQNLDELELGRHGIIVSRAGRRGLFLPQVATDYRLDKETFLSRCAAEKARLPEDAWREADTEVLLFTTEVFGE